jgi:hypothetical protein
MGDDAEPNVTKHNVVALAAFIAGLAGATLLLGGGAVLWTMFAIAAIALVGGYLRTRRVD